ncbi:MAG: hypothetical protein GY799_01650 [Desulfobulbaceae bacterium]|nr:hypothetical protein [Desulfobulbaceae bacterium]
MALNPQGDLLGKCDGAVPGEGAGSAVQLVVTNASDDSTLMRFDLFPKRSH